MIKTSDEGTGYCTQCEVWAKENEHLKEMERLRVMEITRLNGDVTRLDHEIFELLALLAKERDTFGEKETRLLSVARAELRAVASVPESSDTGKGAK